MNNFLKNRKSIRNFKDKYLDIKILRSIREKCNEFEKEGSDKFEFLLFEDGERIFESLNGIGGYSGVMIRSPHYIGLNTKDNGEKTIIYGAYYIEKLITELTNLNVGCCWISIKDVDENIKEELFHMKSGNIDYLLSIGYPIAKNPFIESPTSSRIAVKDIVFKNEIGKPISIEELESRGLDDLFYYIRFAPSFYNIQPWRFVLKGDRVVLFLSYLSDEELNLADAGIIMYYFEGLAKTIGIDSKWKLVENHDYEDREYKYKCIGELKL